MQNPHCSFSVSIATGRAQFRFCDGNRGNVFTPKLQEFGAIRDVTFSYLFSVFNFAGHVHLRFAQLGLWKN